MRKRWKFVGIATVVVVLGLVAAGAVAFAQGGTSESAQAFDFYARFRQAIAGILGISVEQYDSAVQQAQDKVLTDAVNEGWLTQDQADQMRERMAQAPGIGPWGMGRGFGGPGWGMREWGTDLISVAADKLGMSQSDLMTELRNGKSIADVAKEKSVDPQTIVDAYIAKLTENLNQAVTDGKITQKQADAMLEQAKTRVTDQLNGTWEDMGPRGPHGGHGPDWPLDNSGQDDS